MRLRRDPGEYRAAFTRYWTRINAPFEPRRPYLARQIAWVARIAYIVWLVKCLVVPYGYWIAQCGLQIGKPGGCASEGQSPPVLFDTQWPPHWLLRTRLEVLALIGVVTVASGLMRGRGAWPARLLRCAARVSLVTAVASAAAVAYWGAFIELEWWGYDFKRTETLLETVVRDRPYRDWNAMLVVHRGTALAIALTLLGLTLRRLPGARDVRLRKA